VLELIDNVGAALTEAQAQLDQATMEKREGYDQARQTGTSKIISAAIYDVAVCWLVPVHLVVGDRRSRADWARRPTAGLAAAPVGRVCLHLLEGLTEAPGNDLPEHHAGLALRRTNSFPCRCRETIR
jgi:hypothetical protein